MKQNRVKAGSKALEGAAESMEQIEEIFGSDFSEHFGDFDGGLFNHLKHQIYTARFHLNCYNTDKELESECECYEP